MKINGKDVLVCDCEGTMALEPKALAKACGEKNLVLNTHLCRAQIENFRGAAKPGARLLVACTQEAPLFLETADGLDGASDNPADIQFTNIRERAGWSKEAAKAAPKIAALLAEAAMDMAPASSVEMESGGVVLVLGRDEAAIEAAKQVASRLDVTVLLADAAGVLPPRLMDVAVFTGTVKAVRGHLGAFQLTIENFAPALPSSKAALEFGDGADTGASQCDLILDLRGGTPLFPAPEKRDGYFNPDPANPAAVQRALLEITDLVGTFEKPKYVEFDPKLCAHARSGVTGCTRCLDACPAGAITPGEDHVTIDPYVCAGCGTCASVCPTGAAAYAMPAGNGLFERLRTLLGAYLGAGGENPVIFVHDTEWGDDMISAMARTGAGLPARVLPFAVNQVTQIGLDFLLVALAYGAGEVVLLTPPDKAEEAEPLKTEAGLCGHILQGLGYGGDRARVLDLADPEAVESALYALDTPAHGCRADFLTLGGKRTLMTAALDALHKAAPTPVDYLDLPPGAPFGAVEVDTGGCTLCLACVGACPVGALKDNPDRPQLSFREDACVQCGLCKATCPENVIALKPRIAFAEAARGHAVVKEENPFECIRCGKPFAAQSSIEAMVKKLSGHAAFKEPGRIDLIKMCDDCRILSQMEDDNHPMAYGEPRRMRTTDDYLREREELRAQAKKATGEDGAEPDGGGEDG